MARLRRVLAAGLAYALAALLAPGLFCAGAAPEEPSRAAGFRWEGEALLASPLARGKLWGQSLRDAGRTLGLSLASSPERPRPPWYLNRALGRLWKLPATEEEPGLEFEWVEVDSHTWLLARRGRLAGFARQVPLADWDSFELPARRRFGEPRKIHFAVEADPGGEESRRHMHIYRWRGPGTEFYILKATLKNTASQWRSAPSGTAMRVRVVAEGPDVPLFIAGFDERAGR